MELAIANLRKAGMASAVKKEGRETNEGDDWLLLKMAMIIAIVEVNAETDFVVKNDRFQEFLKKLLKKLLEANPTSLEAFLSQKYSKDPALTIDQYRATIVQAIGENIQIKRVLTSCERIQTNRSGVYSHLGGKIVTVVEMTAAAGEEALAKDIAMHVAAASPELSLSRESSCKRSLIRKEILLTAK